LDDDRQCRKSERRVLSFPIPPLELSLMPLIIEWTLLQVFTGPLCPRR
jgi:hypothetical protein